MKPLHHVLQEKSTHSISRSSLLRPTWVVLACQLEQTPSEEPRTLPWLLECCSWEVHSETLVIFNTLRPIEPVVQRK